MPVARRSSATRGIVVSEPRVMNDPVPIAPPEELVLRVPRSRIVVRTSVVLGIAVASVTRWPIPVLLGSIVAIVWAAWEARSSDRFHYEREARTLVFPSGLRVAIETISGIEVVADGPESPSTSTLWIRPGVGASIPAYAAATSWVVEAAAFVRSLVARHRPAPVAPATVEEGVPPATNVPPASVAPTGPSPRERARAFRGADPRRAEARAAELPYLIATERGRYGGAGRTICRVVRRDSEASPPVDPYDRILLEFARGNVPAPFEEWMRNTADARLRSYIGEDLAYGVRITSEGAAREISARFASLFGEEARFFGVRDGIRISANANFDAGLVGVDEALVAILWFESDSPGR